MVIHQPVKTLRELFGITRDELVRRSGVSEYKLERIESSVFNAAPEDVARVMDVLREELTKADINNVVLEANRFLRPN